MDSDAIIAIPAMAAKTIRTYRMGFHTTTTSSTSRGHVISGVNSSVK
jgi:hypothetical protein